MSIEIYVQVNLSNRRAMVIKEKTETHQRWILDAEGNWQPWTEKAHSIDQDNKHRAIFTAPNMSPPD